MPIPLLLHGTHGPPTVTYQPLGPWIVPWRFGSTDAEYETLRTGAGLIDYSTQAGLECRGAERVVFLQRLLTNDLARLTPGAGCQAALLTPSAKLVAELLVLADAEAVRLLCDLPRAGVVHETLTRYLFAEQVTLLNHERREAVLALQGPRTLELLAAVSGTAHAITLPNAGDHQVVQWEDLPIRLVRHSVAGTGVGVLALVDAAQAEAVWGLLQHRGHPFGLRPVGHVGQAGRLRRRMRPPVGAGSPPPGRRRAPR